MVLAFPPREADVIYRHLVVFGVPVGGLTAQEAQEALGAHYQPGLDALRIRFVLDGKDIAEYGFGDFNARFDFTHTADAALQYGRTRNVQRRVAQLFGRSHEVTVQPAFRFDIARVEDIIEKIAGEIHIAPVSARLSQENRSIIILPETQGRALQTASAIENTLYALAQLADSTVQLTTDTLYPRYTQADLSFPISVLGTYKTAYHGGLEEARTRNIQRAARRVHNQVVFPNEVFSAGTIIAAHKADSGYEAALVLVRGEPVEDIGGGVCQVATTLYNAILRAELDIVQRHNHSARVGYADIGFDATLAGTWYDLKFRNTTPQPLLITTEMRGGQLHISLHGYETRPAERTLRFISERTATEAPPPYKEIIDAALLPNERVLTLAAADGYTYEAFKLVYLHGKMVERVRVNTSTYRPLQGVVRVGTLQ